jgi:putative transposase
VSNYIRNYTAGACYFLTLNLEQRINNPVLIDNINLLRSAFKQVKKKHPFKINAIVVLPDHIHLLITLPEASSDYTNIIRTLKAYFSKHLAKAEYISDVRSKRNERGIWQRRFWEHTIKDQRDFNNHMDYIHWNPVKHGYVNKVKDWPHSSFHQCVENGFYAIDWCGDAEMNKLDIGE